MRQIFLSLLILLGIQAAHAGDSPWEKLQEIRSRGQLIVFFDLDETLGYFEERSRTWIVYDGAVRTLKRLRRDHPIVILTGNIRENVSLLETQHPDLHRLVDAWITSEDFAPEFARLVADSNRLLALDPRLGPEDWIHVAYEVWRTDPAPYTRRFDRLGKLPGDFESWLREIYLPRLSPMKGNLVLDYGGVLVDNQFGREKVNESYRRFMETGRAIYAGRQGGTTAYAAPDFRAIVNKINCFKRLVRTRQ